MKQKNQIISDFVITRFYHILTSLHSLLSFVTYMHVQYIHGQICTAHRFSLLNAAMFTKCRLLYFQGIWHCCLHYSAKVNQRESLSNTLLKLQYYASKKYLFSYVKRSLKLSNTNKKLNGSTILRKIVHIKFGKIILSILKSLHDIDSQMNSFNRCSTGLQMCLERSTNYHT